MIEDFAKKVPKELLNVSGSVFYSGRKAFNKPSKLYILGFNLGGSPEKEELKDYTLNENIQRVLNDKKHYKWSAYVHENWTSDEKKPPGESFMQLRVRHLLGKLEELDAVHGPASNLIFERSVGEKDIDDRFDELAEQCWKFHDCVIKKLKIKVILCFGQTAGYWVAGRFNLTIKDKIDCFREKYKKRHWPTVALKNDTSPIVIIAAHPSRSDWTNELCDPTDLVRKALDIKSILT